jgi:hypothetical protein
MSILLASTLLLLPPSVEPVHAAESAFLELFEILCKKGSVNEHEYQLLLNAALEEADTAVAETDQGRDCWRNLQTDRRSDRPISRRSRPKTVWSSPRRTGSPNGRFSDAPRPTPRSTTATPITVGRVFRWPISVRKFDVLGSAYRGRSSRTEDSRFSMTLPAHPSRTPSYPTRQTGER